jgi:sulfonate transport system permease protein
LSDIEQTATTVEFDRHQRIEGSSSSARKPPFTIGKRGLVLLSWLAPVTLVVVWQLLAQAGWLSPQVLPAPSKIIRTAIKLAASESLLNDLGVSLLRAAAGFVIGGGIGFTLGILVGISRIA